MSASVLLLRDYELPAVVIKRDGKPVLISGDWLASSDRDRIYRVLGWE